MSHEPTLSLSGTASRRSYWSEVRTPWSATKSLVWARHEHNALLELLQGGRRPCTSQVHVSPASATALLQKTQKVQVPAVSSVQDIRHKALLLGRLFRGGWRRVSLSVLTG